MENSIILLSTMSPKVSSDKKHRQRCPTTKLALKKNLRRSSIFDKKPETSDIILVENSTETSGSSGSVRLILKSPIVISDSDSDTVEEAAVAGDLKWRGVQKTVEIENWIKSVNLENENGEVSTFSEMSGILSKPLQGTSVNSTFSDGKSKRRFDELFQPRINHKVEKYSVDRIGTNSSDNNDVSCKSVVEDSFKESEEHIDIFIKNNEDPQTPLNKKSSNIHTSDDASDDDNSQAAEMLDELYGHSWRANERNILTHSEPRNRKKPPIFSHLAKTERKVQVYRETESAKSESLLKSLHKPRIGVALMSPLMKNLKNLCDSDSNSDSEKEVRTTRKKLDFVNISDKENLDDYDLKHGIKKKQSGLERIEAEKKINREQSDKENLSDLDEDDLETRIRKKLSKKTGSSVKSSSKSRDLDADDKAGGQYSKTSSKKYNRKASTSSSSSSDENEQWWKPSRKSEFKLYKERKTVKVFSFLASLSKNVPNHQSDPSALIYRGNFKKHRDTLVQKLFKLYNETIFANSIPEDTPIVWNTRMRGTAGYCYCRRTMKQGEIVKRSVRIVLSTKVVDCAERVRDTLVHELCHAATWMVNNVHNGHGVYWRAWADKAMTVYPELPPIRRCHDYDINTKYTYKCVDCGYSIGRHTKSLDIERKRCGHCYGKFEVLLNKQTKEGKVQSVPSTPKKATGFALFVKEHYATMKAPNLNHGEVMKLLGQKFAELKVAQTKD